MKEKEIVLKVHGAFIPDIGYGKAFIDKKTRISLDLSVGEVIEIEGTKTTVALVDNIHPADEGKGIIRIDSFTILNAGAGLGERVKIRKAKVKKAKDVIIAPSILTGGLEIPLGSSMYNLIKRGLLKRPFCKSDIFIIPGVTFKNTSLPFVIIDTSPTGFVSIEQSTFLSISGDIIIQNGQRKISPVSDMKIYHSETMEVYMDDEEGGLIEFDEIKEKKENEDEIIYLRRLNIISGDGILCIDLFSDNIESLKPREMNSKFKIFRGF